MTAGYLARILAARVYDVAGVSPLQYAPALSRRLGNRVYLKREDTQPVFSFKLRGAYNKMASLDAARRANGVVCASAGNHAQGVALAAVKLGCRALVVMPTTTPGVKIDAVRHRGGTNVEVVLAGESFTDAQVHAEALARARRLTFIHPFDDSDVIAGQGTVAMEILRQHPEPIHALFVAIGGGGLVAGIGAYVKQVRPEIRIIGVQAAGADAMARSLRAGRRVELPAVDLFSDGTAVRKVGKETFRIARQVIDGMVTVGRDSVCAAIRDVFQETRTILEPAGALAVAGMKQFVDRGASHGCAPRGQALVAVACGANIDFERLPFVAERAALAEPGNPATA